MYDPLGREGTREEYDSTGRLIAIVDSQGDMTTFNNDVAQNTEQTTDALGNVTTDVYDDQGNIIETIDPLGNITQSTYDDMHHLLTMTQFLADGTNLTTSYTYNAQGQMTSETDPEGNNTSYTYDARGDLLTTTEPLGHVTSSTYDSNGNKTSSTDADGNTTYYVYDASGNLTGTKDPIGNIMLFAYDSLGRNIAILDDAGVQVNTAFDSSGNEISTSYEWVSPQNASDTQTVMAQDSYNANGQVTAVVDPNGDTAEFTYDANGNPVATEDSLGNTTIRIFNTSNQEIETIYPDGMIDRTVYDALGRVIYVTDQFNPSAGTLPVGTHTIYDADGRVIEKDIVADLDIDLTTTAAGNSYSTFVSAGPVLSSTTTTYDAVGRVVQTRDAAGAITQYTYNLDGQVTSLVDGLGDRATNEYDADGRLTQTTDALGNTTSYEYDPDGRLIKTTYADGTTAITAYNANGQVIASTDQDGNTTNYQYDSSGELTAVILPAVADPNNGGALTRPQYTYTYDNYGDLLSIADPEGNVTSFTYDAFDDQLSKTLPLGQTEYVEYDQYGRVWRQLDYKGQVTEFVYDDLNRPIKELFFASVTQANADLVGEEIDYTYDSLGRVSSIMDSASGLRTFTYDAENRITSVTLAQGTISYTYDSVTGELLETSTAFTDIRYGYDVLGRVTTVTLDKANGTSLTTALMTTYTYTPTGNVASMTQASGVVTTYGYDELNHLVFMEDTNASGEVLDKYEYTLDADGNRIAADEFQLQPDGMLDECKVTWVYDALGRLVSEFSVDVTGDRPDLTYSIDYTYDLDGNIVSETTPNSSGTETTSNTYNANGELVSTTTSGVSTSYLYDANGSETEEVVNGQVIASYSYDLQNRLAQATSYSTNSAGEVVATSSTYTYDSTSSLIEEDTSVTVDGSLQSSSQQFFLNDAKNLSGVTQVLEVQNAAGLPQITYLWGSSVLAQIGLTGQVSFFSTDALGSTRILTDASGQITDRYDYTAYGDAIGFNPAGAATTILFGGQQYDPTTGLYRMGARSYDPTTGRFTQADPTGGDAQEPLSLNGYAYADGDPVDFTDPTGFGPNETALGIAVHEEIGYDFVREVRGGVSNSWLRTMLAYMDTAQYISQAFNLTLNNMFDVSSLYPNTLGALRAVVGTATDVATGLKFNTRPDLTDPAVLSSGALNPGGTNAVYEIKPGDWPNVLAGEAQLWLYILALQGAQTTLLQKNGAPLPPNLPPFHPGVYKPDDRYDIPDQLNTGVTSPADLRPLSVWGYGDVTVAQLPFGLILYNQTNATVDDFLNQVLLGVFKQLVVGALTGLQGSIAELLTTFEQEQAQLVVQKQAAQALEQSTVQQLADNTIQSAEQYETLVLKEREGVLVSANGGPSGADLSTEAPGQQTTPTSIAITGQEILPVLNEAEQEWAPATRDLPKMSISIVLTPLNPSLLAQSEVTSWSAAGQPLSGIIYLSPDAAGQGWYIDPTTGDNSDFADPLDATAFAAEPGSPAYGHYDLLTTLEHEVGHILGFYPGNPGYDSHSRNRRWFAAVRRPRLHGSGRPGRRTRSQRLSRRCHGRDARSRRAQVPGAAGNGCHQHSVGHGANFAQPAGDRHGGVYTARAALLDAAQHRQPGRRRRHRNQRRLQHARQCVGGRQRHHTGG